MTTLETLVIPLAVSHAIWTAVAIKWWLQRNFYRDKFYVEQIHCQFLVRRSEAAHKCELEHEK